MPVERVLVYLLVIAAAFAAGMALYEVTSLSDPDEAAEARPGRQEGDQNPRLDPNAEGLDVFGEFPLYWLNEEFQYDTGSGILRLQLAAVIHRSNTGEPSAYPIDSYDRVDLVYGDCRDPSDESACPVCEIAPQERSCAVPLQVSVYSRCGPEPDERVTRGRGEPFNVAAGKAYYFTRRGHVYVNAGDARIIVVASIHNRDGSDASDRAARSAAEQLRPVGNGATGPQGCIGNAPGG